MTLKTDLLIIGAGPFGLSLAAQAKHDGIEHIVVGKSMEFWRRNMPKGMFLRSACDWHLDPQNVHTIEAYLKTLNKTASDVEPLSLEFYLSYVAWFQKQKQIEPGSSYIARLDLNLDAFVATTVDGTSINTRRVVLAPGFKHFTHVPQKLRAKLPSNRVQHTCDFVDFSNAKDKRFLIVGGRQSAFEWAALLLEAGAAEVHIAHRHSSPSFAVADWSWVMPLVDRIESDPGWFRRLSQVEKDEIVQRMWAEGRLKVEPWLEARLNHARAKIWENTEVESCVAGEDLKVMLTGERTLNVDEVVLATGYKVDVARLPYLSAGNVMQKLETKNGFPVLDENFETSVPGLFITSMPAVQDFGPYFGFTIAARASAKIIANALRSRALF